MADIVMADDGIVFDGRTLDERPLGGAETSFIELAHALAARGHRVCVFNKCERTLDHRGVGWAPLSSGLPDIADLYIANRNTALLHHIPRATRTVFWIHNPAGYLLKPRHQIRLYRRRPVIVFSGESHASTYPRRALAGGRTIIPYGVSEMFRQAKPRTEIPPPRAVFTSNPLRSLDWLLDLWATRIRPVLPAAELHVFAGAATYGAAGEAKGDLMSAVLGKAQALSGAGVILCGPVPKSVLVGELRAARVLLYRGDVGETFCSAVAEAQAMGVPTVVQDIACMRERIIDGVTGFVTQSPADFADAAVRLLRDDALWRMQHQAALTQQRGFGWSEAALRFEGLL